MATFTEFQTILASEPIVSKSSTVHKSLEAIQGKWRVYVIYELSHEQGLSLRDLRACIPLMTNTIASTTLKELMEEGIAASRKDPDGTERYILTEKGRDLLPAYYELYKWGQKYL